MDRANPIITRGYVYALQAYRNQLQDRNQLDQQLTRQAPPQLGQARLHMPGIIQFCLMGRTLTALKSARSSAQLDAVLETVRRH
jgi:hypothetical protein